MTRERGEVRGLGDIFLEWVNVGLVVRDRCELCFSEFRFFF